MKKFTVKDFIAYNNPCFSCGSPINFRVGFVDLENKDPKLTWQASQWEPDSRSYLRPVVTQNHTEIDLIIKYSTNEALKLCVFHKTNKILTNSNLGLTKYLGGHKLFLSSHCDKCHTQIESQFLDINVDKGYINAVGISSERLMVTTTDRMFQIVSSFIEEKSIVYVDRLDKTGPLHPFTLELPLIPRYKFKDREHFINKIKTYMLFS